MPVKRKYNTKGTKDFIVLAGIFFFLCLWAIKDAWYPSPKVMEKHPIEVNASFETAGLIEQLHVAEGDSITEGQVLAELRRVTMLEKFEAAKKAYSAAKDQHTLSDEALRDAVKSGSASEELAKLQQNRTDAKTEMDAALEQVNTLREKIDSTELMAPSKGVVKELLVSLYGRVDAGETVLVIDTHDHFYLFNKSLAIFSFIAFWVFFGIHVLSR